MRNPLIKRLPRELRGDIGKYAVILVLMVFTISMVSGFLVAAGSMIAAYDESFEKYNIENGHFIVEKQMNKACRKSVEALDISIYDLFYTEKGIEENDSTLRVFKDRKDVNKVCLMSGELPSEINEIAIDRMYADNNQLQIGDALSMEGQSWRISGLVALSDYSALFSDNSDMMFDAVKFGVGIVSEEAFETFDTSSLTFCYSWKYDHEPADKIEEKEMADDFSNALAKEVSLKAYVPRYLNQAINFTGEDLGGDRSMMMMLLYIIMAIMAFVFAITISNTISKEAAVIGTLRASGYSIGEMVRHYLCVPMFVTLIGAVIGNVLGYTVLKDVCANLYYGSYSLPTYITLWNWEAFFMTTLIPVLMMLVINLVILYYKLTLPILKFLRRDLKRRKQKSALRLSHHIPFFTRFRLRIIGQNISNYMILLAGVFFANILLMFGLGLPSVLENYQQSIQENQIAAHQYFLTMPPGSIDEDHKLKSVLAMMKFNRAVETENETAEKFSAYSLNTMPDAIRDEEIMIYGVSEDSHYIQLNIEPDQIFISKALSEKYELLPGDRLTLREPYEDKTYDFDITGIYDYMGGLHIYMSIDSLNEKFELGDDYYCGYFSETPITDIDEDYIGTTIELDDLLKVSRQLNVSMGEMMYLVDAFSVIIFIVLIYLLSKIIIEKNGQSISMVKILGYKSSEISRLYILSTTLVYVAGFLISIPLVYILLKRLFVFFMAQRMSGWLAMNINFDIYIKMFILGMVSYGLVAILEYRKIKRVPMDEALKNVE